MECTKRVMHPALWLIEQITQLFIVNNAMLDVACSMSGKMSVPKKALHLMQYFVLMVQMKRGQRIFPVKGKVAGYRLWIVIGISKDSIIFLNYLLGYWCRHTIKIKKNGKVLNSCLFTPFILSVFEYKTVLSECVSQVRSPQSRFLPLSDSGTGRLAPLLLLLASSTPPAP